MRLLTSALVVCLLGAADPNAAKVLDMKAMKIGDVGKLPAAVKMGDIESYYELVAVHGTHAMTVQERLNSTINGIPATQTGIVFGVQGVATEGLEKGQKVALDSYLFEVIAEMPLNPKNKFLKTKILKVK